MTDELNTPLMAEPTACPFVAFEDDRDHRSDAPDYRHRCFASAEPEPRAFPHQERYCLTGGFTACPVFLDWARQEAAGITSGADGDEPVAAMVEDAAAPAFLASRPRAGAAAAEVAASTASRRTAEASAGLWSNEGIGRRNGPTAPPPPSSLHASQVSMARRGPTHPGWENPPRLENFPRLRSRDERNGNAVFIGAVVVVAFLMVALVLLPVLLSGSHGSSPAPASGGASQSANIAEASPTPTPTVSSGPTPKLYTVKKTDKNLTSIAASYNVSVSMIVAYNSQMSTEFQIKNPNVIWEGMQFYIPPVGWTPAPATPPAAASPTPTPTPGAS